MNKSTKQINREKVQLPKVALDSPIIKENLPYKYVHYPNHYGTFFMFSKSINSEPFFCECYKVGIQNHFALREFENKSEWTEGKISAPLSSHFFPNSISENSLKYKLSDLLIYKTKLCHRCNMSTPTLRYCHEMYGGNFKQYYGWYINQTSFRVGVRYNEYIENYTPEKLVDKLKVIKKRQSERNNLAEKQNLLETKKLQQLDLLDKEISKLHRKIDKEIENITREEFGFRKIGEGNVSELIMTKIVEKIFPNNIVLKHYRPNWLQRLELDVFIPELRLGIEYQGQQHFFPIKAWGGK